MSNLSQFGFGGGIKSIQRGLIAVSVQSGNPSTNTSTINSVNTSKSVLYFLGEKSGVIGYKPGSSTPGFPEGLHSVSSMIELTNSTTITASINTNFGNISQAIPLVVVSWQLVEYY